VEAHKRKDKSSKDSELDEKERTLLRFFNASTMERELMGNSLDSGNILAEGYFL
jgi:hypothetical protein